MKRKILKRFLKLHLFKYENNVKNNYNVKESKKRKIIKATLIYIIKELLKDYNISELKERKIIKIISRY